MLEQVGHFFSELSLCRRVERPRWHRRRVPNLQEAQSAAMSPQVGRERLRRPGRGREPRRPHPHTLPRPAPWKPRPWGAAGSGCARRGGVRGGAGCGALPARAGSGGAHPAESCGLSEHCRRHDCRGCPGHAPSGRRCQPGARLRADPGPVQCSKVRNSSG